MERGSTSLFIKANSWVPFVQVILFYEFVSSNFSQWKLFHFGLREEGARKFGRVCHRLPVRIQHLVASLTLGTPSSVGRGEERTLRSVVDVTDLSNSSHFVVPDSHTTHARLLEPFLRNCVQVVLDDWPPPIGLFFWKEIPYRVRIEKLSSVGLLDLVFFKKTLF